MPALRRLPIVELLGFTLFALLLSTYRYLDHVARSRDISPLIPLLEETTAVFGAGALFFVVRRLARRYPVTTETWRRHLPLHAGALVLFSATHTTLNWLSRAILFPVAGLGAYDYGRMPVRYAMEFPIDVILYTLFIGGVWAFDRHEAARERELRAQQLEHQLARAQLGTLRLQLQPHFLFNALNTVSSTMFEDPVAADTMLTRLAELLRVSLKTAELQEITLAEELYVVELYLSLYEARFGDRIEVMMDVEEDTRRARVPSFLLQPLIENALTHGGLRRGGRARLDIRTTRRGDTVEILVRDDGRGDRGETGTIERARRQGRVRDRGIGLSSTRERLRLLYGTAGELLAEGVEGGGFEVRIRLPWSVSGSASESPSKSPGESPGMRHASAGGG